MTTQHWSEIPMVTRALLRAVLQLTAQPQTSPGRAQPQAREACVRDTRGARAGTQAKPTGPGGTASYQLFCKPGASYVCSTSTPVKPEREPCLQPDWLGRLSMPRLRTWVHTASPGGRAQQLQAGLEIQTMYGRLIRELTILHGL